MSACAECGVPTDPVRDVARIRHDRVVLLCRDCARGKSRSSARPVPAEPAPIPTPEPALAPAVVDRRARSRNWLRLGARAAVAAVATATMIVLVASRLHSAPVVTERWLVARSAPIDAVVALEDHRARPIERGEIVSVEVEPALPVDPATARWVHPLPQVAHRIPPRHSRRFGAHRDGDRPAECGAGHCGIDYFNARGTPVVAVADGVVERIVLDPSRLSGNYVSLRHADGTCTQYMHLDDVLAGLSKGDLVAAGSMVGSLGHTGFSVSPSHLHFAYRVRGPGGGERFADPAPRLRDARVIDLLDIGTPRVSGGGAAGRAPSI